MKKILTLDWNLGIASGEFISSMLLAFFVYASISLVKKKYKNNILIKSALISVSIIFATVVGWGIGSLIEEMGYGLSLMTPGNIIFSSIYFHEFNAMWMILGAQLIGSIFGWILSLALSYVNKKGIIEINDLIDVTIDVPRFVVKELLFQVILGLLVFSSIPIQQSITSYGSGKMLTQLIYAISIFILLVSSSGVGYFMFSPFITFPVLLHGLITKKTSINHIVRFMIASSIYTTVFIGIGYAGYGFEIKNGRG